MKLILAVDKNWAIGRDNKMLYDLKKDLNHFKETTTGGLVIMGRKTFDSIGFALPKRENLVLTRDKNLRLDDALVFNDVENLLKYLDENKNDREVFVIGGNQIVDLLLPYCDVAILTKIDSKKDADTFLHNFDEDEDFEIFDESEDFFENDTKFNYVSYRRKR